MLPLLVGLQGSDPNKGASILKIRFWGMLQSRVMIRNPAQYDRQLIIPAPILRPRKMHRHRQEIVL